jgi:hypothetical protein
MLGALFQVKANQMSPMQPILVKSYQTNGSAEGPTDRDAYTIKLDNVTVASARAMTEGPAAFGAAPHPPAAGVAHEVTHTMQYGQPKGTAAEVTYNLGQLHAKAAPGALPLEMAAKAKIGRPVTVEAKGRVVAQGRLKALKKASPVGDAWHLVIETT